MSTEVAKAFVQEYQAMDAEGNPIGRPTHLEADTAEEMFDKMKHAHIAAVQALHRQNIAFTNLKNRKPVPAQPVVAAPKMTPEQERAEAAKLINPATAADAVRKLAGTSELEEELKKTRAEQAFARGQAIALQFMQAHVKDFYPCQANSDALKRYLSDNNLAWEVDNLEIAFAAIGDQLAKDPNNAAPINPNNPSNEPEVENAQPSEQPRRQPTFGIQPGAGSGARPTGRPVGMTKKDVITLAKTNKAEFLRRMRDPKLKAEMDAALARG
jgi:hypothetical protein